MTADGWGAVWRRAARRWEAIGRHIRTATGWRVWNPGRYGERWHARFRALYPPVRRPLLFFGLNPGPYGMAQTGIPFTDLRRLTAFLPRLARDLARGPTALTPPGLAPATLRPYLTRTFESSSVRMYRFLSEAFGNAERGVRQAVVANPCPLLFIDPDAGRNRTPADLGRAARALGRARRRALLAECARLRRLNAGEAVEALAPRGCVILGRDAQAALHDLLADAVGERRVIDWEHPARAVPGAWAAGLRTLLGERRLLTRQGEPGRSR